ncbi:hypothetical protein Tco_0152454 [Tanacetum coccineum]
MLHVPPENNKFEGEIIPCSDFRCGEVRDEEEFKANLISSLKQELFLGEDATRAIPNMGFNLVDVEGVCGFGMGEVVLSTFEELQMLGFFLQMGFTLILATLDGLDVGLLGDVIGEDDCDEDE